MSERMEQLLEAARRTEPVSPEALNRIVRRGPPAASGRRSYGLLLAAAAVVGVWVVIDGAGLESARTEDRVSVAEGGATVEARGAIDSASSTGETSDSMGAAAIESAGSTGPSDARASPRVSSDAVGRASALDARASNDSVRGSDRAPAVEARGSRVGEGSRSEARTSAELALEPAGDSVIPMRAEPAGAVASVEPVLVAPSERSVARGRPKGARRTLPPYQPRAIRELLALGSQRLAERAVDDEVRRILALSDRRAMLAGLDRLEIADADVLAFRGALRAADARCEDALVDFSDVERIAPRSSASSYASLARRWCPAND